VIPSVTIPNTHWIGGCLGPEQVLKRWRREKILPLPWRETALIWYILLILIFYLKNSINIKN